MASMLTSSNIPGIAVRRGKVRDLYQLDDQVLIIACDRISAFDVVLPTPIPGKGKLLTQLSAFWFRKFSDRLQHHMIHTIEDTVPPEWMHVQDQLKGRAMFCHRCEVIPIECVVRGYLSGSGWQDYLKSGRICGIKLPANLAQCSRLPEPIFTPATKADQGHDENISFETACDRVGESLMHRLREKSLQIYAEAEAFARTRGIIIADTKFEWGMRGDDVLLIDELLTPDSSRFWSADDYQEGKEQESCDKQFVRDYLQDLCDLNLWNKSHPGPKLPDSVVLGTVERYCAAYERITGRPADTVLSRPDSASG